MSYLPPIRIELDQTSEVPSRPTPQFFPLLWTLEIIVTILDFVLIFPLLFKIIFSVYIYIPRQHIISFFLILCKLVIIVFGRFIHIVACCLFHYSTVCHYKKYASLFVLIWTFGLLWTMRLYCTYCLVHIRKSFSKYISKSRVAVS